MIRVDTIRKLVIIAIGGKIGNSLSIDPATSEQALDREPLTS